MENVCRVCCSSDSNLVDIFMNQDRSDESCIANMLIECVDCDIRPDDCFPKKICPTCVLDTQNAYKFKRRYEQSHQHFCKLLEKNEKILKDMQIPRSNNLINKEDDTIPKWIDEESNDNWEAQEVKFNIEEDNEFTQQGNDENAQTKEDDDNADVIWLDSDDEADSNDAHNDSNSSYSDVFLCHTCQQGFSNETKLILHSLKHNQSQNEECPLCDKVFHHRRSLRRHIIGHSSERPFKCAECGKGFIQKDLVVKHMRTHTGERPYSCPHCQKAFAQSTTLRKHISLHFRPFACTSCSRSFLNEKKLQRHLRRHKPNNATKSQKWSNISEEPQTEDEDSLMID